MSHFAVPWATARLCLEYFVGLCGSSTAPLRHILFLASQHNDTASQQRYKRRLCHGPSTPRHGAHMGAPAHLRKKELRQWPARSYASADIALAQHSDFRSTRRTNKRPMPFHRFKMHPVPTYCQLQIRNVYRARFCGPGPLFPTARLLSSLLCPESDRNGDFRTRCRILPHLPVNLALSVLERSATDVRSTACHAIAGELVRRLARSRLRCLKSLRRSHP